MKNKCIKIIVGLLYFVFIILGIVIGRNFNIPKWPIGASKIFVFFIFVLIGSVIANVLLKVTTKVKALIFNKMKEEAILIFKFSCKYLKKLIKFIADTFEFASALTILLVTFLYLTIIADFLLLLIVLSILCAIYVMLSFAIYYIVYPIVYIFKDKKKPYVVSRIITSLLVSSLLIVNLTNLTIRIPEMISRTYNVTYHLNENETLVGGNDYYYYHEGLSEDDLGTAKKKGHIFKGWYLNEKCSKKFEPFEGYTYKGNIDLYPCFEFKYVDVEYVFRGYDYTNKYKELESNKLNQVYKMDDYVVLNKVEDLKGYAFIGYSLKEVSAEDFLQGSYSLITAFGVQQEYIKDGKIIIYALFVKLTANELLLNKITDINLNEEGDYALTNITYKIRNLTNKTYTLVINHGKYENDSSKACFIEAVVYDRKGTVLSVLNSKEGGGQFQATSEEIYFRFNEVDSEGNILKDTIHKNALVMVVEDAKNAKTLAPTLTNNEEGTNVLEQNFELDIENSLYSYMLDHSQYVYNCKNYKFNIDYRDIHGFNEIGFVSFNGTYDKNNLYVAVTFFYEGKYYDGGYACLTGKDSNEIVKAYDLNNLIHENYTMNISLYSDYDLSDAKVDFVMK